jgi:CheY-like chemotaxis protein
MIALPLGTTIASYRAVTSGSSISRSGQAGRGSPNGLSPRILVVEDEKQLHVGLTLLLKRAGYSINCVRSGADALAVILASLRLGKSFDLLLLDINMSEMSGLELMDELDRNGIQLARLVMTGLTDDETLEALRRRGCRRILSKPLSPDEVMREVAAAIAAGKTARRSPPGATTAA